MSNSDTRVTFTEDEQTALIELGDALDGWRRVAQWYEDKQAAMPDAPAMGLYQEIGRWIGFGGGTVRSWVGMRRAVGEDVLDAFPQYRLNHWRKIRAAAVRMGKSKDEKRELIAALADKYADNAITPETLAVKLNGQREEVPPRERAKLRVLQALESWRKHEEDAETRRTLAKISERVEAL